MAWNLQLARDAARAVERLPTKDRTRLIAAFRAMAENPFGGDIKRLRNERAAFRRRVGSYRVFFDVDGGAADGYGGSRGSADLDDLLVREFA
jgi:mRNA-degrading endonuclease RelE of RelBE toxin-antitoxin system